MRPTCKPWNRFHTATSALRASDKTSPLPERGPRAQLDPLIILGAGLAGCWLARLLAERGIRVRLLEAGDTVANGASGNPAGIAKPHVTRSPCRAMDFHVQAHTCLRRHLQTLTGLSRTASGTRRLTECGVLQLVNKAYPPSPHYQSLNADQVTGMAGFAVGSPALHFADGGWLNPGELCRSLVAHPNIDLELGTRVLEFSNQGVHSGDPLWRLGLQDDSHCWTRRLVLACGTALKGFEQTRSLPLVPARGQLSRFALRDGSPRPRCVINGKHYLIPDGDTIVVGASFQRDICHDHVLAEDHAHNLTGLRSMLPAIRVHDKALSGSAGVRTTTPDRLPVAGPAPDLPRVEKVYADLRHGRSPAHYPSLPCHSGLYLLGGLGSRGIITAPLAAEWLADRLMQEDDEPTQPEADSDWADLLNPARFRLRDLRRGVTARA
ncbi:FAD-dependent 5-carboxymethylaminomethyl-2-thiouridine(34) oxidoreductase MnmC [Granulosicoccus sp. 3-233]|uniref:FAD-dependent 5-carboxymethylaminomethyl-2-thiouridine(34) oxidoreductase MnmC n=1 Tax=Granulosicoccus sp. 3-233 TaxID=3417969 RepID=UPI003D338531